MSVSRSSSRLNLPGSTPGTPATGGPPPQDDKTGGVDPLQRTPWKPPAVRSPVDRTPVRRAVGKSFRPIKIPPQLDLTGEAPSPCPPRYPVAIRALMDARLAQRAGSDSIRQHLAPVDAFFSHGSNTRPASPAGWETTIAEARQLGERALFPAQKQASNSYTTFRDEINPLLQAELELLEQLPGFLDRLRQAGADISQIDGPLCDLMELLRPPALTTQDLALFFRLGFNFQTLVAAHRCGLTPTRLAETLDCTRHSRLTDAESVGLFDQLLAYRQSVPDMPVDRFLPLARAAFACDLPVEHLKPMLLAGVPITAAMKPDSALSQATVKEESSLGGGASGSPVKRVTLVMPDGTERQVVTKVLNMAPLSTPDGPRLSGVPFPLDGMALALQTKHGAFPDSQEPARIVKAQRLLSEAVGSALLRGEDAVRCEDKSSPLPPQSGLPNLYGRDLAMRQLADALGRPGLVSPVRLAVIGGVYCEVSDHRPDLGQEVVRHTGDPVLSVESPVLQKAVTRMTETQLQRLATSRGFERAERQPDGSGIRFFLKAEDQRVGYYNHVDPGNPVVRQRYADHMVRNYLANEADGHPGNFSTGVSWDHDGSFGITDAPGFSAAMPKVVSASVWAALQDGAWGAQRQRFEGLIQPAEIAAMEQRRQALIAAHNTKVLRVVDDTEWDTDEVAQAMGCTALDAAVAAFRQQTDAVETTGQARAEAVKALAATIDDLPADQLLAQHAGMWRRASLTVGAGQPAPTAFLDPKGWTAEIEKLAAEQDARGSAERPAWAQHLGGHFDGVAERHAEAIHNSQRTLKRVVDSLASYGTSTLLAATGDEPAYRKKAKAAVKLLEQLRRQLETGDKLEAKIELQRAIAAEIGSWNRMTELVAAHQARFPNTLAGVTVGELLTLEQVRLPQAEPDVMLKSDRSMLPAIQREGPDVDDLQELIAARTHFAPHLPLAHFIVMKLASIPVNAHTVPDPRLSTEVAHHELSRLGSGQTATVWQADLGPAIGAWAFKPEPGGTEVPDAGIDTGIQRLRPGERLGPNFTGRTVASAKTAQALEFHGAPESRPVVFRDPESGRLMYGAASRLVKGSMLQEAEGKPAVLALDVATVDRLQALEEGERQTVIDRVARRMGFVSATWDSIGQNITLTPGTEFRRNLDWTDPDLRRSLADGALWAALTAQADNHAGNYMQETTVDGVTRLVAIDNDVSAGAGVRHPMEAAAEYNRAAWVRHLQGGVYNPPRPNHITASVRRELLTLGATGLAQQYPLPARPEPTAETRKAHLQKFEGLIRDLETASRVPLGTSTTRAWQRRLTARGNSQTHAAGIPKVISQRMAQTLTALTEDQVRNRLFGGLGQAEQDAAWERTQVLQQMVRGQAIQPVKDTDWGSDRVRDLMGLNPKDLKRIAGEDLAYAARDPRNIGTPDGDRHRLEFGLAAAFALQEQMARQRAEQIRRGDKDQRGQPLVYQGPALFDREALNRQLRAEAEKAKEARRVRQREEQGERAG